DGHRDAGVDQQRFHGAADAVAVSLGVEGAGARFFGVGGRVDVHVAVTVKMLDERHAGFVGQARDQAFSAARHDDVDVFGHGDELAYGGAVGGVDDLYGLGRQGSRTQACLHHVTQRDIGMHGFAAAAQNGGVAGFEA